MDRAAAVLTYVYCDLYYGSGIVGRVAGTNPEKGQYILYTKIPDSVIIGQWALINDPV